MVLEGNYRLHSLCEYTYMMGSRNKCYLLKWAVHRRPAEPSALSRASADAFKAPDYEGWLHKQGDKYKTWNKRWFVLKGPNLFYFKSPKVRRNQIHSHDTR